MSQRTCCVPGCSVTAKDNIPLHKFPDPKCNAEKFNTWVTSIGGNITTLNNKTIYLNRRVCHRHFKNIYKYPKNKLCKLAIPETYVQENKPVDHSYASKRHDHLYSKSLSGSASSDQMPLVGRDSVASQIGGEPHTDNHVDDDHLNTESEPTVPVHPQFSWQKTSLISLDEEAHTVSKRAKFAETQSEAVLEDYSDPSVTEGDAKRGVHIKDTDYCCDACRQNITGYTCVQCTDYDLCAECETKLTHPEHYMLRVPDGRPQREVKLIIDAIRRKLQILEAELKNDGIALLNCDVEIKKEEDPFEEITTETVQHHTEDTAEHCEVPDILDADEEEHIEENMDHDLESVQNDESQKEANEQVIYDSESEHSDKFESVQKDKGENEDVEYDSELEDWLDEPLLEIIDCIDSGCDSSNKRTLQDRINDTELEKNVTGDGSETNINHKSITYVPVPKASNILKSKTIRESVSMNERNMHFGHSSNIKEFDSNNKVVHPPKRKSDVLDESSRLFNIIVNKPVEIKITTKTSSSTNEIPVHPAKRKPNVHEGASIEIRQSSGLSKVITANKTIEKTTKINTGNIVAGKLLKLSDLHIGQVKESRGIVDSNNRQLVIQNKVVPRKRLIVKLNDISDLISKHKI